MLVAARRTRLSALMLALTGMLASVVVFAAPAQAAEIGTVNGITYDLADGESAVTAVSYDGSQGDELVVPDSVTIDTAPSIP